MEKHLKCCLHALFEIGKQHLPTQIPGSKPQHTKELSDWTKLRKRLGSLIVYIGRLKSTSLADEEKLKIIEKGKATITKLKNISSSLMQELIGTENENQLQFEDLECPEDVSEAVE